MEYRLTQRQFMSPLEPSAIKSLQKALPGYQTVTDDAAGFGQKRMK
jgi:hypothetical protein